MLVCVVIVYWASAHSIPLQVMRMLMLLLWTVMIVWDTGTTVMSGPAMIRSETLPSFILEAM